MAGTVILPLVNPLSTATPSVGFITIQAGVDGVVNAVDSSGVITQIGPILGTPSDVLYFDDSGYVTHDSLFTRSLNNNNTSITHKIAGLTFGVSIGRNLTYTSLVVGTAISGYEYFVLDQTGSDNPFAFGAAFLDPYNGAPVIFNKVTGITGGAVDFSLAYDDGNDIWSGSIHSTSVAHSVESYISTEASYSATESRSSIRTYDTSTQEQCVFNVYYNGAELTHNSAGATFSTSIILEQSGVAIGDVNGTNNSTKIVLTDIDSEIKLLSGSISVNNNYCWSGTYSTGDSRVVTVINGLITNVL